MDAIVHSKRRGGSSQLHMAEFLDSHEQPAFPHLCFLGTLGETPACGAVPRCAVSVQDKGSGGGQKSLESEALTWPSWGFPDPSGSFSAPEMSGDQGCSE